MERICFQVELAHWFYEDFHRAKDSTLPKMSMEEFTQVSILPACAFLLFQFAFRLIFFDSLLCATLLSAVFEHCPVLMPYRHEVDDILTRWKSYKTQVPVYGAIMLNPALDKCILVKGWTSKSSWGFPKGKINKDEPEMDCAIREVFEETGFDLEGKLRDEDCTFLCRLSAQFVSLTCSFHFSRRNNHSRPKSETLHRSRH